MASVSYDLLNQTHPDYDAHLWAKIDLLYEGGFKILEHAAEFVPKLPMEGTQRYEYRLRHASYIPYFAQVVGYLVGTLFLQNLEVTPDKETKPSVPGEPADDEFYARFAQDADLAGASFARLMRKLTIDALKYRRGVVVVDMPPPVGDVESRATEELLGAGRAYAQLLPIEQLLDWKRDPKTKRFQWCVLRTYHCDRETLLDTRDTYYYRFKWWALVDSPELGGRRAAWKEWRTSDIQVGQDTTKSKIELLEIGGGVTSFRDIPIVELDFPPALWLGNKIGPLCEEHYRRRSELCGAMAEANVEIPTINLGPEIGGVGEAMPAEVQQDPGRGHSLLDAYRAQGFAVFGAGDKFQFVGPDGVAFELTAKQLNELRDEIYRVVDSMALSLANTGASVGRSGESKREDRSATANVLSAMADLVRGCAVQIYDIIAAARGEASAWSVDGLDTYDLTDATAMVEQAQDVAALDIPSPTFQKEHLTRVAFSALPGATSQVKAAIAKEIEGGLEEREHEKALMREQLKKAAAQIGQTPPGGDDEDESDDEEGGGAAPME